MKEATTSPPSVRDYFDEAGDGTLFNKHGRVIVGTEGCSRFFILGLVEYKKKAANVSGYKRPAGDIGASQPQPSAHTAWSRILSPGNYSISKLLSVVKDFSCKIGHSKDT